MSMHRNKAMFKADFVKEVPISSRSLLRDMERWKDEILILDPDFKRKKILIPSVVDFLAKKYFGTTNFKIHRLDELPEI